MKSYKEPDQGIRVSDISLRDETGAVALLVVLWVIVILTAIVLQFSYSMRTEINITRNFKEEAEAYQAAIAGLEKAKIEILMAGRSGYIYQNEEGVLVFNVENEAPERSGRIGRGTFSYSITDEESRLNINTASPGQLRYLFLDSGVEITEVDKIVDPIIDWRDENSLHMLNGAEEEYYRSLKEPYSCKDGPFESIEELLLVKGMTEDIFYGSKHTDDEQKYKGVVQYLTVRGKNSLNINTSPAIVLEVFFGLEKAGKLLSQRETGPITASVARGKVLSDFFTVISTGANSDNTIRRSVKAVLKREAKGLEVIYWNDNFFG